MSLILILGLLAGALTTISLVPQVMKTWTTKSAGDLSLGMYSIFCLGVFLWLIYGLVLSDIPIIIANAVTLVLALSLLFFKVTYKD